MARRRPKEPHLWKHRSGVRYLVWQEDGKTRMRSTGTKKVAEAEAELRAFREDWERRRWGRREELSVAQALDEWIEEKRKTRWNLSESTKAQYRIVVDRLKAFLPSSLFATEVTTRDLRRFLDHLEDKYSITPQGIRKRVGILSMMFTWLSKEGVVARNPAMGLDVPKAEPKKIGEISVERYQSLLDALKKEGEEDRIEARRRNALMLRDLVQVLWLSGIRSIDAYRLTWNDIDLRKREWTIRAPKNKGGIRTVPIHDGLLPVLKRRKLLGSEGPFPPATHARLAWARFKKRTDGFAGVNLHSLRYSFVSRMERLGSLAAANFLAGEGAKHGDRTPTSQLVGHQSARMTAHYTQWRSEDLRALLNSL